MNVVIDGSSALRAADRIVRSSFVALQHVMRAEPDADHRGPALRARAVALQRLCVSLRRVHRLRVDVLGRMPDEPMIIVANHLGYLDPIAIGSLRACMPIAKSEVRAWPIVGSRVRAVGAAFVERGNPLSGARVIRQAWAALRSGVSVLNFPEGTTTHGDHVRPFRRGVFGLARLARVPILPLRLEVDDPALCWVGDDTFFPHYLRFAAGEPPRIRVHVGAPLHAERGTSDEAFAERVRGVIATERRLA